MKLGDYRAQPCYARQQRLAPVQHDLDRAQAVLRSVLSDPPCRLPQHFIRDGLRAPPPALISRFVHVAVITGKITTAMNLEDELIQREAPLPHAGLRSVRSR